MIKYQKAVTFSYDDGVFQDRRLVELFNRYDLKATFNLNTGIQTEESHFEIEGHPVYRMNQGDIGNLYHGHEIAVHGLTHAAPVDMTDDQLEEEFGTDIANIIRLYGRTPVGMAYAYGAYDDRTVSFLEKKGIRYGRTVESSHSFKLPGKPILLKPTCHHNDERLFDLVQQFLEAEPAAGEQLLLYIWGHSYEFDVNDNWEQMERLCQMVSGREDVFYGTNRQCLELFQCI